MDNSPHALDLYAKVEDLLGVKEVSPRLYAHYLLFLNTIEFDTLLDVGCGSGDFLIQMQEALSIPKAQGIDLSPLMVSNSVSKGVDAHCLDLCDMDTTFDVITAVFDMLNYLPKESLISFLSCVKEHLCEGGVFVCDINTLYGFENVAVGSYIVDDEKRFLTVDSDFEGREYISEFTLFEQEANLYSKSQETIRQYYYTVEELVKYSGLTLLVDDEVSLYEFDEADKRFIVLGK